MGFIDSPIKTVVLGKAMSMGALIFICGDKRQMTKRSTIMFHEISSGMHGKISDMVVSYKETERLSKLISKIVKSYTNIENIDTKVFAMPVIIGKNGIAINKALWNICYDLNSKFNANLVVRCLVPENVKVLEGMVMDTNLFI